MAGGGQIGIGAMDRHAVVRNNVAWLKWDRDFATKIVWCVIDNPLRESQNLRLCMRPKPSQMRACGRAKAPDHGRRVA